MSDRHLMGRISNRLRTYADNLLLTKKGRLIRKVKARKAARADSPYIYTDNSSVSLVLQSFNHRDNIERIVDRLRLTVADELIVCEDGSVDGSAELWRRLLVRPNDFLIQSNDLHEIRTYNRAISLARGEFVGVLQDDDIPPENSNWVADAITLFRKYPKLAVLGCWNGWAFGSPVGHGEVSLSEADCRNSLNKELPELVDKRSVTPDLCRLSNYLLG